MVRMVFSHFIHITYKFCKLFLDSEDMHDLKLNIPQNKKTKTFKE